MSDADDVWTQVTLFLRSQLAESVWFSTFQDVVPLDAGSDTLRLLAPSAYVRDRILTRYLPLVTDALEEANEGHRNIDIEVAAPALVEDPVAVHADEAGRLDAGTDHTGSTIDHHGLRLTRTTDRRPHVDEAGLNPRYTFEAFVKGASNQFALAAALRVAETPGGATTRCSSTVRPDSARRTCCTRSATTSTTTTSITRCATSPPRRS